MGAKEVERYLSHLATHEKVAVSTQKQALNALVFLYRDVLHIPLGEGSLFPIRSKRKVHLPTVLTVEEVEKLFNNMSGSHLLKAQCIYGSGMRLMECIRLRIQDVDFGQGKLYIKSGKGGKDRITYLPQLLFDKLQHHIERVKDLHQNDLKEGFGEVYLPGALGRKYTKAAWETFWQYVFPSKKRPIDPRTGKERRHHVLESGLQKAVKAAVKNPRLISGQRCIRYATPLQHICLRMVPTSVYYKIFLDIDVKTTEIYTHVMRKDLDTIQNSLDRMYGL